MPIVNVYDAKTRLSQLIDAAASGTDVIIARNGKPVARLTRLEHEQKPRYRLGLLDTEAEERFDRHARIAAAAFEAPIALVTLIDRERQWYKARHGFDFSETSRDMGFCSHAILQNEPLVVNDALRDDRFADNPVVVGDPHVRFYAGIPLHAADGARVGAFCIVDSKPRSLSAAQLRLLKDFARVIEEEIEPNAAAKAG